MSWLRKKGPEKSPIEGVQSVIGGLINIYQSKILPVEQLYEFHKFHSHALTKGDFENKPTVLLLGQYSTGKTSFLKFILETPFPGMNIGPEPTTDRFLAIMWGAEERVIPGNALAVQADKPYRGLQRFGTGFLNKFAGSSMPNELLENFTFIDTPGVLSGEKQRIGRSYDFSEVCRWFAERADLILLLFDAHKLDISDEFKAAIESLAGHEDKIRVVLNKADMVSPQQLMRVYGALMWSLGKVFQTPEVCRVYISSFWEKPYARDDNTDLFNAEKEDLFKDLMSLPRNSAIRKINELVKRARLVRVHALIIGHLKASMPSMMGKKKKQDELIAGLAQVFKAVAQQYTLSAGDFPDIKAFREKLKQHDFSKFNKLDEKLLAEMERVLANDIPALIKQFPEDTGTQDVTPETTGGWLVTAQRKARYDKQFASMSPDADGKVSGGAAKGVLMESGLPVQQLGKIWELADIDQDGKLTDEEFAIAMYLVEAAQNGKQVPDILPNALLPPSMRQTDTSNPFA